MTHPMTDDDRINRDMVSYYRDRAQEYDRKAYDPTVRPEVQSDIREATRILQEVIAGKDVLEIAAGTGFWTEKIATTALSITATDINPELLEIAKTKHYPKRNATFHAADMYALAPPPAGRGDLPPYDALFGGFIFSHILKQDRDSFLDTICNYVVPRGTIVLMDNNRKIFGNVDRTDAQGNNWRLRTLEDGSKHEIPKNYPTETELNTLLRDRASKIYLRNLEYYWILIYQTA